MSDERHPTGEVHTRTVLIMLAIDDKSYRTISDAAKDFRVKSKTVRDWIHRGIIPVPPQVEYGLRQIRIFPEEYMRKAMDALQKHKGQRRQQKLGDKPGRPHKGML